MKKISIGIMLLLMIFSWNKNNEQVEGSPIVGKWNISKITNNPVGGSMPTNQNEAHFYQIDKGGIKLISLKKNISKNSTKPISLLTKTLFMEMKIVQFLNL